LTRDDVARAALAEGVSTLSMPTVARRLGVGHSTLYRYVHDRDDLLLAAFEMATREFDWPSSNLGWRELLESFADAVWRFLQRYPGMAEASQTLPGMPAVALDVADAYVARLRREGLSGRDAAMAVDFVADLTIAAEIGVRRMSRLFDTPRGRRSLRELYEEIPGGDQGPLAAGERFGRRGWLEEKLAILLDGLAGRLGEPVADTAGTVAAPPPDETPPDRDTIAAVGRDIARRDGLHAVSVHSVADELGATVTGVRRTVGDRDGIVVAMLDAVSADIALPAPAEDPRTELIGLAMAAHAALRADPWAIVAVAFDNLTGPQIVPVLARFLTAFRAAGVPAAEVGAATGILWEHVYGAVLGQVGDDTFAARVVESADLGVPPDGPDRATIGIEILVDGLLARG
jgi:AcrR family transcriptional regulator